MEQLMFTIFLQHLFYPPTHLILKAGRVLQSQILNGKSSVVIDQAERLNSRGGTFDSLIWV